VYERPREREREREREKERERETALFEEWAVLLTSEMLGINKC